MDIHIEDNLTQIVLQQLHVRRLPPLNLREQRHRKASETAVPWDIAVGVGPAHLHDTAKGFVSTPLISHFVTASARGKVNLRQTYTTAPLDSSAARPV